MDAVTLSEAMWIAVTGLAAGLLGGLLGVGGSVIMIPALTALLGPEQHLYQAAAMAANVAVALPAARRHHKAGVARVDVLRWMLPAAVLAVLLGVAASNLFEGDTAERWLKRLFALLLLYVIAVNIRRLIAGRQRSTSRRTSAPDQRSGPVDTELASPVGTRRGASAAVGGVMGFVAGLLGIGGGAIAVPLQQVALRLPLRSCIANSSIVIVFSAAIGAVFKIATLDRHGLAFGDALLLAGLLAPTALLGGRVGASPTHRLPL
ncbi:MAG: TSUP family transporter, partial [Phycisphaeraceae bacterium]